MGFLVALGNKLMDDFPLMLTDGSWLESWPAIYALGVLMFFEIGVDFFPCIAEVQDMVMSFVKPAMAIYLAASPIYWSNDGLSTSMLTQLGAAANAGVLSEAVALFKAFETATADVGSAG